jgi:autotransporter-associated beta strand protein
MDKTKIALLVSVVSLLTSHFGYAGSATWDLDPSTDDWNTPANWSPATVPDAPSDVATFAISNLPEVRIANVPIEVSEIDFSAGASPTTITATNSVNDLTISGAGVINNSGIIQNFATVHEIMNIGGGEIILKHSAKAGTNTVYTIGRDAHFNVGSALTAMYFSDAASADHSSISVFSSQLVFSDGASAEKATILGGQGIYPGGEVWFIDHSSAADARVIVQGATAPDATQGSAFFDNFASAGNATFLIQGGSNGGPPGFLSIGAQSTAANASLTATGGGVIYFSNQSEGDVAKVALFDGGMLNVDHRDSSVPLQIGSLRGDGLVVLANGRSALAIGANDLSTHFDGLISGDGSINKIGQGTLVLTQDNTYTGGTTVKRGVLLVNNVTGSATGSGEVQVEGGTLGGKGIIGGLVTVGTGAAQQAVLAPGTNRLGVLTTQQTLAFGANGVYNWNVDTQSATGDGVAANGVTISATAVFNIFPRRNASIPPGALFTVIDNTAATPMAGTFSNLPDGGTITVGNNTYQANYEGGDGNDLTLTVVP